MVPNTHVNSEDFSANTTLKILSVKNPPLKVTGSLKPHILLISIQKTSLVNVTLRMDGSMMKTLMMADVSTVTQFILIAQNAVMMVLED